MTIIQPNKRKSKSLIFITAFVAVVFGGAYLVILLYNETVDLRYAVANQEKELGLLQIQNAELKNKTYSVLSVANIAKTAGELGLVLDNKPTYVEPSRSDLANNL